MKTLTIPIHSFVDLITNSSTEIYITASKKSLETVKELVDNLLVLGGSQMLKADDLFEFSLTSSDCDCDKSEAGDDDDTVCRNCGNDSSKSIVVKPKSNSQECVAAAKVLSDLTGIFSIDANYNA